MNDDAQPTEDSTQDTYIHLPEDHPLRSKKEYELRTPKAPDFFGPVRRVNVLVGPNNAGKSRFMRAMHGAKKLIRGPGPFTELQRLGSMAEPNTKQAAATASLYRVPGEQEDLLPTQEGGGTTRFNLDFRWHDIARVRDDAFLAETEDIALTYRQYAALQERRDRHPRSFEQYDGPRPEWQPILETAARHANKIAKDRAEKRIHRSNRTTYFPPLRTAHAVFGREEETHQEQIKLYGITTTHPDGLINGQKLYRQFDQAVRGRRKERLRFSAFETWLSTRFFAGLPVTLVPRHAAATERPTIAVEIDGEERELENLGDGLQQLIILTFPLFMADEGDAFFIEEPETHMHPGLQRAFLEVLLSEELAKKNLLVFLTTHSNHLMAAALERPEDVSLFRFHRLPREKEKETVETSLPRFEVTHVSNRDIALLQALGVMNGSVFLAQCQIWVEGPSDITYFKAYLKSLEAAWEARGEERFERLLENRDYVFVMYGGSLLDTIRFDAKNSDGTSPFAIGNRILLIADADHGKESKHEGLKKLAEESKGQMTYRPLEVREVENTVAPMHLKRAMQALYKGMKDVADDQVFDVPGKEYLGRHFKRKRVKLIDSYVSRSGSWNDKTRLANEVSKGPLPWSELRPTTQDLTLALDRFIRDACGYTQPSRP